MDPLNAVLGGADLSDSDAEETTGVRAEQDLADTYLLHVLSEHLPGEGFRAKCLRFVDTLRDAITNSYSGVQVDTYGSLVTEIDLEGSDIDIVVRHHEIGKMELLDAVLEIVNTGAFGSVRDIRNARVPIIRIYTEFGVECDITFNRTYGIDNTRIIQEFAQAFPKFQTLARLVKVWKARRYLPDSRDRGLSSYAWVLLVMHFLQRNPEQVRWSYRELMHHFFFHLLRFDNTHQVIGVRETTLLTRVDKNWTEFNNDHSLCIEDPVETWRDLGKAVRSEGWEQIFAELARGYLLTSTAESTTELMRDPMKSGDSVMDKPYLLLCDNALRFGFIKGTRIHHTLTEHSMEMATKMDTIDIEVEMMTPIRAPTTGSQQEEADAEGEATKKPQQKYLRSFDTQLIYPCSLLAPVVCTPLNARQNAEFGEPPSTYSVTPASEQFTAAMGARLQSVGRVRNNSYHRLRVDDTGASSSSDGERVIRKRVRVK